MQSAFRNLRDFSAQTPCKNHPSLQHKGQNSTFTWLLSKRSCHSTLRQTVNGVLSVVDILLNVNKVLLYILRHQCSGAVQLAAVVAVVGVVVAVAAIAVAVECEFVSTHYASVKRMVSFWAHVPSTLASGHKGHWDIPQDMACDSLPSPCLQLLHYSCLDTDLQQKNGVTCHTSVTST